MRNEVSNSFAFLNRNYQIATNVNGKPSWKNGAYAIWYMQNYNYWFVGRLSEIGNAHGFIYASNDFSGITDNDNQWLFWNGNAWTSPSDPNNIKITCMDGKYTLFTILLYILVYVWSAFLIPTLVTQNQICSESTANF